MEQDAWHHDFVAGVVPMVERQLRDEDAMGG
jgi:hypothetical protein